MKVFSIANDDGCKVFVDCGANDGLDALEYSRIGGNDMEIWAFEAIPETFSKMEKRVENHKNIKAFNLGLGQKSEKKTFSHFPNRNYMSSAYTDDEKGMVQIECQIVSGDEFFAERNVNHIDYLKIDVEGMEMEVIKGFTKMIEEEKIDVIQFEYTSHYIHANYLLKSVYDFFENKNYKIGKIYPNRVDFFDYNVEAENFFGANFVAINKKKEQLIKKLA
ncbi:MAG: FkbM family methyltransferase [Jhaorihella sp.]